MNDFFGAWVVLGMFVATLVVVLLFYGVVEWRREEGSSFFSLEFLWRLLFPELILAGLIFVFGIGLGATIEGENWALDALLCFLAVLIVVAMMWMHHAIIVRAHTWASRSRRPQGKRVLKAAA